MSSPRNETALRVYVATSYLEGPDSAKLWVTTHRSSGPSSLLSNIIVTTSRSGPFFAPHLRAHIVLRACSQRYTISNPQSRSLSHSGDHTSTIKKIPTIASLIRRINQSIYSLSLNPTFFGSDHSVPSAAVRYSSMAQATLKSPPLSPPPKFFPSATRQTCLHARS